MDTVAVVRKRMLRVVVGCLAFAALLSVAVVLGGSVSGTGGKIVASAILIPLACLFALAGSTVLERVRILGVATIAATAIGAGALQAALWTGDANSRLGQLAVGFGAISIYGALASLLVSRSRPSDTAGVHVAEILGLCGLAVLTLVVVSFSVSFHTPSDDALKLAGIGAIVGILGLLAAPIVRLANRGTAALAVAVPAGRLESLIGLRVVAVDGAARNVLVFENGVRIEPA
jgi:hypothetical protein